MPIESEGVSDLTLAAVESAFRHIADAVVHAAMGAASESALAAATYKGPQVMLLSAAVQIAAGLAALYSEDTQTPIRDLVNGALERIGSL